MLCEKFQLSIVPLKMVVLYIGHTFPNSIAVFLNISFIKLC